jgi:hypothetical protein
MESMISAKCKYLDHISSRGEFHHAGMSFTCEAAEY